MSTPISPRSPTAGGKGHANDDRPPPASSPTPLGRIANRPEEAGLCIECGTLPASIVCSTCSIPYLNRAVEFCASCDRAVHSHHVFQHHVRGNITAAATTPAAATSAAAPTPSPTASGTAATPTPVPVTSTPSLLTALLKGSTAGVNAAGATPTTVAPTPSGGAGPAGGSKRSAAAAAAAAAGSTIPAALQHLTPIIVPTPTITTGSGHSTASSANNSLNYSSHVPIVTTAVPGGSGKSTAASTATSSAAGSLFVSPAASPPESPLGITVIDRKSAAIIHPHGGGSSGSATATAAGTGVSSGNTTHSSSGAASPLPPVGGTGSSSGLASPTATGIIPASSPPAVGGGGATAAAAAGSAASLAAASAHADFLTKLVSGKYHSAAAENEAGTTHSQLWLKENGNFCETIITYWKNPSLPSGKTEEWGKWSADPLTYSLHLQYNAPTGFLPAGHLAAAAPPKRESYPVRLAADGRAVDALGYRFVRGALLKGKTTKMKGK